jgi:hypothetical protein
MALRDRPRQADPLAVASCLTRGAWGDGTDDARGDAVVVLALVLGYVIAGVIIAALLVAAAGRCCAIGPVAASLTVGQRRVLLRERGRKTGLTLSVSSEASS